MRIFAAEVRDAVGAELTSTLLEEDALSARLSS